MTNKYDTTPKKSHPHINIHILVNKTNINILETNNNTRILNLFWFPTYQLVYRNANLLIVRTILIKIVLIESLLKVILSLKLFNINKSTKLYNASLFIFITVILTTNKTLMDRSTIDIIKFKIHYYL